MSRDQLECFVEAIENLILEEERHSDPSSGHYIPHDLARWFLEATKGFLDGEVNSLDRALGLIRPPGHPVDPSKSKNLDLAEKALTLRMQGRTGVEINNQVFADRAEPPDERHIRTIVNRYKPLVMQKWREDLRRRWLAGSEVREKRSIQKNQAKGKSRTANSG
jgi:hypothetical protein